MRPHPFAEMIGLTLEEPADGISRCQLDVSPALFNPNRVLHGAVAYALADTGMGAALVSILEPGEVPATIEIKINYLAAAREGTLTCESRVISRRRRVAVLESDVRNGEQLVAKALGTFAISPGA